MLEKLNEAQINKLVSENRLRKYYSRSDFEISINKRHAKDVIDSMCVSMTRAVTHKREETSADLEEKEKSTNFVNQTTAESDDDVDNSERE